MAINFVLGLGIAGSWWGGSSLDEATAVARGPEGSFYFAGTTHSTGLTAAGSGVLIRTAKALYPGDVFVQRKCSRAENRFWTRAAIQSYRART